jgi:hypothetical protein
VLVHDDCSVAHRVVLVVVVPGVVVVVVGLAIGVVLVVVVPGVVVVVVPTVIGTHVHFAQKVPGPQPPPSHCSPMFGSVTPSPHTDGAPRSASWLRPTTSVPVSSEQPAAMVARRRTRPGAPPQAPASHAARTLVAWRVVLMRALVAGQAPPIATRSLSMATIARPPVTGRSSTAATKSPVHGGALARWANARAAKRQAMRPHARAIPLTHTPLRCT